MEARGGKKKKTKVINRHRASNTFQLHVYLSVTHSLFYTSSSLSLIVSHISATTFIIFLFHIFNLFVRLKKDFRYAFRHALGYREAAVCPVSRSDACDFRAYVNRQLKQ